MCHIYTVEYYLAIKRNKIELFVVWWMDLESVIQSEVSQKEKNKLIKNNDPPAPGKKKKPPKSQEKQVNENGQ